MTIPIKQLQNGFSLPVLGFGTWGLGGYQTRDDEMATPAHIDAIHDAVAMGVTHFDVAEIYAEGYAETILGSALRSYDRSTLQIASKVNKIHASRSDAIEAVEQSLKRLSTDYLDLIYLHSRSDVVALAETMDAFNALHDRGLVRAIALSNMSTESMLEAQQFTALPIVCNQVHYNVSYREPETSGLLAHCQANDVLLCAYRPLQRGALANTNDETMIELATKYSLSPAQLALSWVMTQENVITIPRLFTKKHLEEAVAAAETPLANEDVERIRTTFPDQHGESERGKFDS